MKAKGKTFYLLLYKGFLLFFRSLLKPYLHQRQLTTFPISVDKFAFLCFYFLSGVSGLNLLETKARPVTMLLFSIFYFTLSNSLQTEWCSSATFNRDGWKKYLCPNVQCASLQKKLACWQVSCFHHCRSELKPSYSTREWMLIVSFPTDDKSHVLAGVSGCFFV